MGIAKAKDSVEGRNAFHAVFLYCRNSNRTFAKKNHLCYNVGEGGQAYAREKVLHSD